MACVDFQLFDTFQPKIFPHVKVLLLLLRGVWAVLLQLRNNHSSSQKGLLKAPRGASFNWMEVSVASAVLDGCACSPLIWTVYLNRLICQSKLKKQRKARWKMRNLPIGGEPMREGKAVKYKMSRCWSDWTSLFRLKWWDFFLKLY